jgi:hypothetical protein
VGDHDLDGPIVWRARGLLIPQVVLEEHRLVAHLDARLVVLLVLLKSLLLMSLTDYQRSSLRE